MNKLCRGFTLIELLTVIAIIGILTAIVVPNLNGARMKGRDSRRISDLKSIQIALAVYYDTHRADGYPADIYDLVSLAPYIPSVPKDPKTQAVYLYGRSFDHYGYCLGAILEGAIPPEAVPLPCNIGLSPNIANYTVKN